MVPKSTEIEIKTFSLSSRTQDVCYWNHKSSGAASTAHTPVLGKTTMTLWCAAAAPAISILLDLEKTKVLPVLTSMTQLKSILL